MIREGFRVDFVATEHDLSTRDGKDSPIQKKRRRRKGYKSTERKRNWDQQKGGSGLSSRVRGLEKWRGDSGSE